MFGKKKKFFVFPHSQGGKKREAVVYVCAGSFWVQLIFGNTLRRTP
jgi:hypothetical protein